MNLAVERIESEIRDEFLARHNRVNPLVLVVASQLSFNKTSCKFAVVVQPHTQITSDGPKLRIGARWLMHVPNVRAWSLTERQALIKIVIDEVIEYLEKGTIDREKQTNETGSADDDAMRIRVQRSTDRTIQ